MKTTRFIFILLYILSFGFVSAQSVADVKALCKTGEYSKALSILSIQLKQKPKDATLNLWSGICLIGTGDLHSAEKNLLQVSPKVLPDVLFYLGEVQYLSYRFDESVVSFSKFLENPKTDQSLKPKAEKRLSQSQLAARLMKGVEKIQIIDSLVVDKNNFMSYYQLSPEVGAVRRGDSIAGAKQSVLTSVYENQRNDKKYFSEKTATNGTDIFTKSRLMDTWGEKVALSDAINTKANENFPFVLSDGVTLYFASDGEGSIGGYDIFVTRYNLSTDSYLSPENVGMPINSIYNDYLLAIDEQNNIGWFASDRGQPKDKVVIYVFIPNETKTIVNSESSQTIARLATIHAIRDTWVKGADYSAKLTKIKHLENDTLQKKDDSATFRFVVDDQRVYRSMAQFRNEEAKKVYKEVLKTTAKLRATQKETDLLRMIYAGSDKNFRIQLSSELTAKEKEVEDLTIKLNELEQKVRKLEKE